MDYDKLVLLDSLLEHDPDFMVDVLNARLNELEDKQHVVDKLKDANAPRPNLRFYSGYLVEQQRKVIDLECRIMAVETRQNQVHDLMAEIINRQQTEINDRQNALNNIKWNYGL